MGRWFTQDSSDLWFVLVKDLDFGQMGCFMPSSERWDVMHFAFMFGGTYAPIWMTASTRNGKTWRFMKMANSKVILVLPITCSEPFAWFESLACPLSRFLKCNWPNNVFQKCSNWIKLLDFSTSKGKHTSLCSIWRGFLLWQKSQVQRRPLSWVQKRGNWIGY